MRIPSPFRFWHPRAVWVTLLLLCLSPFVAAQTQKPPAKPSKPTAQPTTAPAPQASQATPKKPGSAPPELDEDGDIIRQREQWFYGQRAYPLGQIPPGVRLKALEHLDKMIQRQNELGLAAAPEQLSTGSPGPLVWTSIGTQTATGPGANFGFPASTGRITAIAIPPTAGTTTIYLGGAAGGVWKSTDGGATWTTNFDQQPSLAIGAIAIAPSNTNIIYVATGEGNFAGDNYYGAGVIKSTDGGTSWTQTGTPAGAPFAGPTGSGRLSGGFTTTAIAVHPTDPNTVLVAARNPNSSAASGIYRTTNGGSTWSLVATASGTAGTSVVFDPSNGNNVYAALGFLTGNAANGIYKSIDAGVTFTKLTTGLPTSGVGRIELAIAPSFPSTLYAAIGNSSTTSFLGLFKSTDSGATWTQLTATPNFCTGQCWYDMAVRVSPASANSVYVGGSAFTNNSSTMFRSLDGGTTWTDITIGSDSVRPHVDTHALAFLVPTVGTPVLVVGNDGGIWKSANPESTPVTWQTLNNPALAITQFYPGHSVHPSDENIGFGGTQDNGTQKYTGSLTWQSVTCGDGAWTVVDVNAPTTVYGNCQNIDVRRSFTDGNVGTFTQVRNQIGTSGDRVQFIPPFVQDQNISGRLYFGTFRIWQTNDYGDNWSPISPDLSAGTGNITTIAAARSDSNVVYAGTTDGRIQRTVNAGAGSGATWSNLTTTDLPPRFITMVAVDRNDANTAFVSFSGFSGFADTKGHLFKTTNGGVSWLDVSCTVANCSTPAATDLPNIPVNDIVIDKDILNTLYVATDIGVFQTTDGGATWSPLNPSNSLPRVPVTSLVLRRQSRILRAATHGRSAWILQLTNVAPPPGPDLTSITPSSKLAGSAGFTMTLDGFNFLSGSSQVQWNGSSAGVVTTFVSANQLTATIPASLLTQAGLAAVTVFDATQTPTTSGPLAFSVLGSAPTLTSINPTSTAPGGPAFPLTATGSGFLCGGTTPTLVDFGGDLLTPTSCSATSMQVTVPASDIATSRGVLVRALTRPPGGGSSNALSFVVGTPPSNDNFANAINASPTPFTDTKDTTGATTEVGEPVPPSATCTTGETTTATHSIWYRFTAPSNGTITADTSGSNYDTILQAVTGSLGAFTSVACNDDAVPGTDLTSKFTFTATSGVTYFFMTSGFLSTDFGTANFHLTFTSSGGTGTLSFNPASVNFGNQAVGTTSAVMQSVLTNAGPGSVTLTNIQIGGANPGDFVGAPPAAGDCGVGTVLNGSAPGNTCNLRGSFAPTATGLRTATITVTATNSTNSPVLNVQGTGTQSAVTFTPPNVPFANQLIGTTSAVTNVQLSNTGNSTLNLTSITLTGADTTQFALAAPTSGTDCRTLTTVAAGASCNIGAQFKPTTTGAKSASISVADDAPGSPQSVPLTGTGTQPGISFNTVNFDFGNVVLGQSGNLPNLIVTNTGTGPLSFSSITVTGTDAAQFVLVTPITGPDCRTVGSVNPSANCRLAARFTPTSLGVKNASITIADNAPGSPHAVALVGTGVAPVTTLTPSSIPFGNVATGQQSAVSNVQVQNTGTSTLNITSITLTGADFTQFALVAPISGASPECSVGASPLSAGNSCFKGVRFQPTTTGLKAANFSVADDATGSPHTVSLTGTGVVSGVALSPSPVNFANQRVGTTSGVTNVTVTNTGGVAVHLAGASAVTLVGGNAGDFSVDGPSTTCTNGLTLNAAPGPGNTCNAGLKFGPTATGARTTTLSVADDAAGSPQTVPLTGTGTAPAVTLNPTSFNFGSVLAGQQSAVTNIQVTNSGTDTLNFTGGGAVAFTLTGSNPTEFAFAAPTTGTDCRTIASLAAGSSCDAGAKFTPLLAGPAGVKSASINIADDASTSPQQVPLSGTSVFQPVVSFDRTTVPFGNQRVGTPSAVQDVVLTNSGNTTLNFTGGGAAAITLTGADTAQFALAAPTTGTDCRTLATVAAGANCRIGSRFSPTSTGAKSASISVADDAAGSPQTVALTGTGIAPAVTLSPTTVPFGTQKVGTTSAATHVHLTNSGTDTLNITSIALTGTDPGQFTLTSVADGATPACPLGASALAAGSTCNLDGKFAPTTTGAKSANISFTDDATGSPQTVPLTGTGAVPSAPTFNPTTVPFGTQKVGTTSGVTNVSITNNGSVALAITSVGKSGADAAQYNLVAPTSGTPCPSGASTLNPGASCNAGVSFSPTSTGAKTASLDVTDDAGGAPGAVQSVSLSGTGAVPTIPTLNPTTVPFGNQQVGATSAVTNVAITNSGPVALAISSIAKSGADAGQFNLVAPTSGTACPTGASTLNAGASCSVGVSMAPTTIGAKSASVVVTDDAGGTAGTTQSVSLSGKGVDFAIAGPPSAVTVTAGQPATFTINLTTTGGPTANTITFSASGNPAATTVTFNPATIPAGSATGSTTMTITTTARTAVPPQGPARPLGPQRMPVLLWTLAALLALASLGLLRQAARTRRYAVYLPLALLVLGVAGIVGCSNATKAGTPAGTTQITVTATLGTAVHTTTVTLTVN